jgi:hypothetical protein
MATGANHCRLIGQAQARWSRSVYFKIPLQRHFSLSLAGTPQIIAVTSPSLVLFLFISLRTSIHELSCRVYQINCHPPSIDIVAQHKDACCIAEPYLYAQPDHHRTRIQISRPPAPSPNMKSTSYPLQILVGLWTYFGAVYLR